MLITHTNTRYRVIIHVLMRTSMRVFLVIQIKPICYSARTSSGVRVDLSIQHVRLDNELLARIRKPTLRLSWWSSNICAGQGNVYQWLLCGCVSHPLTKLNTTQYNCWRVDNIKPQCPAWASKTSQCRMSNATTLGVLCAPTQWYLYIVYSETNLLNILIWSKLIELTVSCTVDGGKHFAASQPCLSFASMTIVLFVPDRPLQWWLQY